MCTINIKPAGMASVLTTVNVPMSAGLGKMNF